MNATTRSRTGFALAIATTLVTASVGMAQEYDVQIIAQGLDADLVVLDQHNQVDSVMARGAWHVKNSAQLLTGLFEE